MRDCRCGPREWDPVCESWAEAAYAALDRLLIDPDVKDQLADAAAHELCCCDEPGSVPDTAQWVRERIDTPRRAIAKALVEAGFHHHPPEPTPRLGAPTPPPDPWAEGVA